MALVPKPEDNDDKIIKPQLSAPAVDYSKFPYTYTLWSTVLQWLTHVCN